ncbi:MAG: hypothetical protein OXG53_05790 [Chloroflexi bacterium]|nr:hypothetical protein [Chloroflexota bacterium]
MLKTLHIPFYPWLAGAFPIIHLYTVNYGLVFDREVPIALFWMLAATTICYIVLYAAIRNLHVTAMITTAISLCFSLSGHLYSLIAERESLLVWTASASILAAIIVSELLKTRKDTRLEQLALPLNLIAAAMILMQVITLVELNSNAFADRLQRSNDDGAIAAKETTTKSHDSGARPDIYFIVPDGYPSDTWLQSAMNFDNSAFTEALQARGFVIAPHAQSNYGSTLPSLASVLNMRHFNANPSAFSDLDYLRLAISDSEVARYLLQRGYTYVHLLSRYLFPSPIADINRDFSVDGPVEISMERGDLRVAFAETAQTTGAETNLRYFHQRSFLTLFIQTTMLEIFANQWPDLFLIDSRRPYDMYSPHRFLDTIDEINRIVAMPEATFTFVHLLKPHRPVVFDEHGNIIRKEYSSYDGTEPHLAELKFINRKFIEMIDTILEGSPHQPVIIFQADHGTTNGYVRNHNRRMIHFDIYSAYFIPDRYSLQIPQPYTTINTFPLILNSVFDAGLAFSENRLFEVSTDTRSPLLQTEVTATFANWLN